MDLVSGSTEDQKKKKETDLSMMQIHNQQSVNFGPISHEYTAIMKNSLKIHECDAVYIFGLEIQIAFNFDDSN